MWTICPSGTRVRIDNDLRPHGQLQQVTSKPRLRRQKVETPRKMVVVFWKRSALVHVYTESISQLLMPSMVESGPELITTRLKKVVDR